MKKSLLLLMFVIIVRVYAVCPDIPMDCDDEQFYEQIEQDSSLLDNSEIAERFFEDKIQGEDRINNPKYRDKAQKFISEKYEVDIELNGEIVKFDPPLIKTKKATIKDFDSIPKSKKIEIDSDGGISIGGVDVTGDIEYDASEDEFDINGTIDGVSLMGSGIKKNGNKITGTMRRLHGITGLFTAEFDSTKMNSIVIDGIVSEIDDSVFLGVSGKINMDIQNGDKYKGQLYVPKGKELAIKTTDNGLFHDDVWINAYSEKVEFGYSIQTSDNHVQLGETLHIKGENFIVHHSPYDLLGNFNELIKYKDGMSAEAKADVNHPDRVKVKKLQKFLNEKLKDVRGFEQLIEDGMFGEKSKAAVVKFQEHVGSAPDGIFGKNTLMRSGLTFSMKGGEVILSYDGDTDKFDIQSKGIYNLVLGKERLMMGKPPEQIKPSINKHPNINLNIFHEGETVGYEGQKSITSQVKSNRVYDYEITIVPEIIKKATKEKSGLITKGWGYNEVLEYENIITDDGKRLKVVSGLGKLSADSELFEKYSGDGLKKEYLIAVADHESAGFYIGALSSEECVGIMQMNPLNLIPPKNKKNQDAVWTVIAKKIGHTGKINPYDPEVNIAFGAELLKTLIKDEAPKYIKNQNRYYDSYAKNVYQNLIKTKGEEYTFDYMVYAHYNCGPVLKGTKGKQCLNNAGKLMKTYSKYK